MSAETKRISQLCMTLYTWDKTFRRKPSSANNKQGTGYKSANQSTTANLPNLFVFLHACVDQTRDTQSRISSVDIQLAVSVLNIDQTTLSSTWHKQHAKRDQETSISVRPIRTSLSEPRFCNQCLLSLVAFLFRAVDMNSNLLRPQLW